MNDDLRAIRQETVDRILSRYTSLILQNSVECNGVNVFTIISPNQVKYYFINSHSMLWKEYSPRIQSIQNPDGLAIVIIENSFEKIMRVLDIISGKVYTPPF